MIARLLCLLGSHAHCYIERRSLHGLEIPHFICEACGHAVPAVARTQAEYRSIARSQVPAPKAKLVQKPTASEKARAVDRVTPFRRRANP